MIPAFKIICDKLIFPVIYVTTYAISHWIFKHEFDILLIVCLALIMFVISYFRTKNYVNNCHWNHEGITFSYQTKVFQNELITFHIPYSAVHKLKFRKGYISIKYEDTEGFHFTKEFVFLEHELYNSTKQQLQQMVTT
ncbi:hypothetical protein SAMN05216480_10614 [Pustulibacterium marinum]|uniref:Uncharacterized protein n=1 Tax=Pustulibacterium marinum TaxID=1224947 RepID=A0A1I7GVF5_9FLAO|nr:hypothetical protein [Pustulibacterium marinum]SFU52402.1 hypothetical protein SAMN05216480_10614 [Pustulibacterium marinum]